MRAYISMTKSEFNNSVDNGAFMVVAEYRSSVKEMLEWRDKLTGKPMSAPVLRHNVEVGDTACTVNERVADGVRLDDIVVKWRKGERVVIELSEMTRNKGAISCRGRLVKYEEIPSPGVGLPVGGGKSSARA